MSYVVSYDAGLKPFTHDKNRGKWSRPMDFIFACAGHAFRGDTILFMSFIVSKQLGILAIGYYFLILAVCIVPITFIQSFLGQFSGTGFISVFRIAPLFKGIGYLSLILNVTSLIYYIIFSAVPLILFTYVLLPSIPWSCNEAKNWMNRSNFSVSPCEPNGTFDKMDFVLHVPSMSFFHFNPNLKGGTQKSGFSWFMFLWSTLVCIIVILIAMRSIKTVGRFARISYLAMIGLMSILLVRFVLLPDALLGLNHLFNSPEATKPEGWFLVLYVALTTLGPGWGSTITMASFNNFKTNIYGYSWILSFVQFGVVFGMTLLSLLMGGFLMSPSKRKGREYLYSRVMNNLLLIPTGLGFIEIPRFWLLIFFGMLFLGSLNLLVVQVVSILTTLSDEFEVLRSKKTTVYLASGGILVLSLLFFCWIAGFSLLVIFMQLAMVLQVLLNLLLILVVMWVYGRERFQRDVVFMTSRVYSKLKVAVVRFVTPIVLIIGTFVGLIVTFIQFLFHSFPVTWVSLLLFLIAVILIPLCMVPCCCIYQCMETTGGITMRLKRCVRPNDWYPADPEYRQRYEETFGNSDIAHQLTIPADEVSVSELPIG